ncbi:MAG: MFS transporter [Pseudomonadota bacterium]
MSKNHQTLIILACGGLILALSMGVRQSFGLFAQDVSSQVGIGLAGFGLAIAVQNLLWGLFTPLAGIAADRFGVRLVVVLGGVLYGAGTLLMAWGTTPVSLGISSVLVGFAVSATGFPLILGTVARVVPPQRRSMALGITSSGGTVGQFILSPLAGFLHSSAGWVTSLVVLAVLAFVIMPLAYALVVPADQSATQESDQTIGEALREAGGHRGFLLLTAGFCVCGFHIAFVGTHLPGYLSSAGLPLLLGATALGVIGFFNIIGTLSAGYLGDIYKKKYLLVMIYLVRAVIITVFLIGGKNQFTVLIFSMVFGLFWLSTVPLTSGLVGQIFGPRYMSTLFGIVMLSHQLGAFFGAWLGGVSYDITGSYDSIWYASIILGVISALLHWPIADAPVARLARQA